MAKLDKVSVAGLFGHEPDIFPETPLDFDLPSSSGPVRPAEMSGLDLTDKPKLLMTFGPGRVGKTTFLRWAIERAVDHGNERLVLATMDAVRPTLRQFFPEAMAPKSADQAMPWFEQVLSGLMNARASAAIDFGADMSLVKLLNQVPKLHEMIEEAGVAVVAAYLLSPRSSDLTVLAAMEAAGFTPAATVLVLNIGSMADTARDPQREFAQIRHHSLYRATLERGAMEVWMPRHYAAKAIEDRRIAFRPVAGGEGSGPPLQLFDKVRAAQWLRDMDTAFSPIASWLP